LRTLFPADDIIAATVSSLMQNPAMAAAAEGCFVAEAQTSQWTVDTLKQLSSSTPAPLFVLADSGPSQWEEAALFAGAEQLFRRPLRAAVLQLSIARAQRRRIAETSPGASQSRPAVSGPDEADSVALLSAWRDFSRLLGNAGDSSAMLSAYLERLRDVLRASRVLLYTSDATMEGMFSCRHASGVDVAAFQAFRLGLKGGLGQLLAERGTAVRVHRLNPHASRDVAAARELAVFGGEIALPVGGAGAVGGILILGPRISGADYGDHEVALVYQAMEPLAAILHQRTPPADDSVSGATLLHALPVAAAIVTENLHFIETNLPFRSLLGRAEDDALVGGALPPTWTTAISAAVKNSAGSARVELEHRSIGTPRKVRLTVRRVDGRTAAPHFLVTVEDIVPPVPHDADPHSIGNLLQRAGEQLSNEFRNALTPVDIMVQLSHDASTTRLELEQLSKQVSTAIHRLRRRIDDLAYLTKSAIIPEATTVSAVLRITRERLDEWVEHKHLKRVVWLNEFSTTPLMADGRALAVALAELVLNAIEACDGRQVTITAEDATDAVVFRVRNFGVWAPPPESSGFRHRPFVSSKSTGVGLGIEVATRVADHHNGKLVLGPVSADAVEAVLRVPRSLAATPAAKVETRVARAL
jgi:nitrogen-specific signal transduction histidine kinase